VELKVKPNNCKISFDVIATIPSLFNEFSKASVIGRATQNKIFNLNVHDLRDYTDDPHRTIDDRPFGGGAGMVLKPEPLFKAVENIRDQNNSRIIILSPQGIRLNQEIAIELAEWCEEKNKVSSQIILICGRYEGIDERVIEYFNPELLSIGDYIISGGEVAAMVVIETVARLFKGVLGNEESLAEESFHGPMIEYPHYTRPQNFREMKVPDILISGNHSEIRKWREEEIKRRTKEWKALHNK